MARIVSLVVLVIVLLATAGLFFEVMANFLLPLFLAVLLVIMFGPLYRWFRNRCGIHDRIAALLTTMSILLIVLIPLSVLLVEAGYEAQAVYQTALRTSKSSGQEPASNIEALTDWGVGQLVTAGNRLGISLSSEDLKESLGKRLQQLLAPLALRTTQFLGELLVSLGIMILATYYFFADGALMVESLRRLSPIEGHRMQELLDQFDGITRAVVVATLLSAFVQGLLAGVGYYFAGVSSLFLLTALSMLLTLVPFVGTALVWVPVCFWLYAVEGRSLAAIILAVYCMAVVSTVDNLVKPLVLHGRSNLHPLLALLSVLGGVQALGPIGILVGPMIAAFLQSLLNIVHAELQNMTQTA